MPEFVRATVISSTMKESQILSSRAFLVVAALTGSLLVCSAAAEEGINLSWDDCGANGTSLKQFACDTNEGEDILVLSFMLAAPLPEFIGVEMILDVRTTLAATPDWWRHSNPFRPYAECRDTVGMDADVEPGSCASPYSNPIEGINVGGVPPLNPQVARLVAVATQPPRPVSPDVEYGCLRIVFTHYRATGPGACGGCLQPACIVLNQLGVFQSVELDNDLVLSAPLERNWVTWQSELPTCPGSTPARRTTWGRIKSLYR